MLIESQKSSNVAQYINMYTNTIWGFSFLDREETREKEIEKNRMGRISMNMAYLFSTKNSFVFLFFFFFYFFYFFSLLNITLFTFIEMDTSSRVAFHQGCLCCNVLATKDLFLLFQFSIVQNTK